MKDKHLVKFLEKVGNFVEKYKKSPFHREFSVKANFYPIMSERKSTTR